MTILLHAENGDIIEWLTEKLETQGMTGECQVPTSLESSRAPGDFESSSLESVPDHYFPSFAPPFFFPDPIHHTHSRPQIVEAEAAGRAIVLAELVQSPLVLVHVSAGGAAMAIREAQGRDLPIMGETCPQYLFLSESSHLSLWFSFQARAPPDFVSLFLFESICRARRPHPFRSSERV